MHRLILPVALLLAAGCLAGSPETPDPPVEPAPLSPLEVSGCAMAIGFFPVPMEAADARLPEGFEAVPYRADVPGQARASAWVWTCERVAGADGGWADAWTSLLVRPPEAWAEENASFHAVLLEGVNDREDMAARYAEWGVAIGTGAVALERASGPAALVTGRASLASGPLTLELRAAPSSPGGAGVVRAFAVADGVVTGAFEYRWTPYDFASGAVAVTEGAGVYGASGPLAGAGGLESGADYAFVLQPVPLAPR